MNLAAAPALLQREGGRFYWEGKRRGATLANRRQPAIAPSRYVRLVLRLCGATAGPSLRSGPAGDCDRPAWLVCYRDVLLIEPATGRFSSAKRRGSTTVIAAILASP